MLKKLLPISLLFSFLTGEVLSAATLLEKLRCEGLENPLGIDAPQPGLSWMLCSDERGQRQTACQILVASSPEKLSHNEGDLWDSGRIEGEQSVRVPYAGKSLASDREYFWKVRIWDVKNQPTAWSPAGKWHSGLLAQEDWKASWISASKWFSPNREGWFTTGTETDDVGAWVRVDLGQSVPIDKIRLLASGTDSFPVRFRVEASEDYEFASSSQVLLDQSKEDFSFTSPGVDTRKVALAVGYQKNAPTISPGEKPVVARFVRVWVLKSPVSKLFTSMAAAQLKNSKKNQKNADPNASPLRYQSKIRQLEVWSGGRNVALYRPVTDAGSYASTALLVDGMPSAEMGERCPADAIPLNQSPMLRKSFRIEKPVKRAVLYYAAHGMVDLSLNGKKIDDTLLGPPFTDYTKRILYRAVDTTGLLASGENVIGAVLGNGFFSPPGQGHGGRSGGYGPPRFLGQIELEFADGTRERILTDASWKWAPSEVVKNDLWQGYAEDRRLAQPGWDRPGFVDTQWRAAAVMEPLAGKLIASLIPPIRELGQLKPVRVESDTAFFEVYSAGWPRLRIEHGKPGQIISFEGDQMPASSFTLAQEGPAVLEPRFLWGSGPLKVRVKGLGEPLNAQQICLARVGADLPRAGGFHCSNPWLNELHDAVLRTHMNYNLDNPMDPMREKQAWTQDVEGFFNSAVYLSQVEEWYRKWWNDMADNQQPDGIIGAVEPIIGRYAKEWNSPWWSGVLVWLPWEHYLYYGDRQLLETAYEPMRRYVDFLERLAACGAGSKALFYYPDTTFFADPVAAKERMLVWSGAGDWMNPKPAEAGPSQLRDMAGWYYYAKIVAQTAAMLGKSQEAAHYTTMAEDVRQRTNAKFLDTGTGLYAKAPKSQSAQILPLALGLVPEELKPLTHQRLLEAIKAQNDHHCCGFVSLTYLIKSLTESYDSVLLNRIVNQNDFPSWKTLMHDGVLFETWKGQYAQMPACGGAIGRWFYEAVLGIRPDPAGPGFKRFILAPQPDPATGLTEAEGFYDSPYGRIVSKWKLRGNELQMEIEVPANTMASVRIPTPKPHEVKEGDRPLAQSAGVKVLRHEPEALWLEVSGGRYHFVAAPVAGR